MNRIRTIVVALFLLVAWSSYVLAEGQFDHIINAADVEKVTGLSGVKQVAREKLNKFRNGDLNFLQKDDQPLLMIQFRPEFILDELKADSKAAVAGIGDEAFTSPAVDPQFSINFKKGHYIAVVTTHIDPKDKKKTVLSMDQLTALAKLVASRMK